MQNIYLDYYYNKEIKKIDIDFNKEDYIDEISKNNEFK